MARGEGSNSAKKRRGVPRAPSGLGTQPRISDLIAFAVAFAIAYFLVTCGYCALPWCSGGVLETATAITAVIGSILGLIWRAMEWVVRGGQGARGSRSTRRPKKPPILTVVADEPLPEAPAPAERRDGAGVATPNSVGQGVPQLVGGNDVTAGRESPSLAPTMWPMLPLQPSLPLEPPVAFEGVGRPRDAD